MSVVPPMQFAPRQAGGGPPDDAFLVRGRQLTMISLGAMLGADLLSVLATVVVLGGAGVFSGLIRLAIVAGLAYATWRGNNVAKWILVVLGFLGALSAGIGGLMGLFHSPIVGITSLIVAGAHIGGGILLLTSAPVTAYLGYQRQTVL